MEAMHSWKIFIMGEKLEFNLPAGPEPSLSPAPRGPSPAAVLASFPNLANSSYYLSMDLQMGFSSGQTHQSLSLQDSRHQDRGMAAEPTPLGTCRVPTIKQDGQRAVLKAELP